MKSIYVVDALGWDMGCAAKIVEIIPSKTCKFIYVVAVRYKNTVWLEPWTERYAKDKMGPDCNGDLPKGSFKVKKRK